MKPIEVIKFEAIKELYPNVFCVRGDKAFDENDNEIAIDETTVNTKITELENAEVDNKANGNQKLLDLGLTQAEATALTGYTPPIEE